MTQRRYNYGDDVRYTHRGRSYSGQVAGQLGKDYVWVVVSDLELVVTVHPDRIASDGSFEDWERRIPIGRVLKETLPPDIWEPDDHLAEEKLEIIKLIKTMALIDQRLLNSDRDA